MSMSNPVAIELEREGAPVCGARSAHAPPLDEPPSWRVEAPAGEATAALELQDLLNERVATVDWYHPTGSPFSHYYVRPDDVVRALQEGGSSRVPDDQLESRGHGESRTGDLLRRAAAAMGSVRDELRAECAQTQYFEDDDAKRDSPLR